MSRCDHVVVLGQQSGAAGSAETLVALNLQLRDALRADGLLGYAVLQNEARPESFCAYWLWRHWEDREALWSSPPAALTRFVSAARPHWGREPEVRRYTWSDGTVPPAWCTGDRVRLAESSDVPGPGTGLLPDSPDGTALSCATVGAAAPADHATWRVL